MRICSGQPNLVSEALTRLGVVLPDSPQDLSEAIRAAGANSYVIVTTGRSGSTWLTKALQQVPGGGSPDEFFSNEVLPYVGRNQPGQSLYEFMADIVGRHNTNGAFGLKIDPLRLSWLEDFVMTVPTFGGTNAPWIDLRRWDIVKQAFSYARAKRSGVWHVYSEKSTQPVEYLKVSDKDVLNNMIIILRHEQWIDLFYNKNRLSPLRIFYEELRDSKLHLLSRVLYFLNSKNPPIDITYVRDGTSKISGPEEAKDELEFVSRHVGMINEVMARRATIDPEALLKYTLEANNQIPK